MPFDLWFFSDGIWGHVTDGTYPSDEDLITLLDILGLALATLTVSAQTWRKVFY